MLLYMIRTSEQSKDLNDNDFYLEKDLDSANELAKKIYNRNQEQLDVDVSYVRISVKDNEVNLEEVLDTPEDNAKLYSSYIKIQDKSHADYYNQIFKSLIKWNKADEIRKFIDLRPGILKTINNFINVDNESWKQNLLQLELVQ